MDDSTRSGTSLADDMDEFDRLLEDDVVPAGRSASAAAPPRAARGSMMQRGARSLRAAGEASGAAARTRPRIRVTPDWNRIAAVLFVAGVVLMVVYFAVSSVLDARRASAYKDYFGEVREISAQSAAQGEELDTILDDPNGGDRSQRLGDIEQLGARADELLADARAVEAPEQLTDAHGWFVTTLEYRARGIDSIQRALTAALESKDREASAKAVAGAITRLAASDVIYTDSFTSEARRVLRADQVQGVTVGESVMLEDLEMTSPKTVSAMLDRLRLSGATTPSGMAKVPQDGKIRGGQLEGGRLTVAPSGQTLALDSLTEIKGGDSVTFEVPFTNQGEVQLTEVPVKIVLRGADSDPIELVGIIDSVDPGQSAVAKVALDDIPTFGEVLEMDVLVGPIPGEKTTDNNRASYQVQFTL